MNGRRQSTLPIPLSKPWRSSARSTASRSRARSRGHMRARHRREGWPTEIVVLRTVEEATAWGIARKGEGHGTP